MRKVLYLTLFVLLAQFASAQTSGKDSVLKVIAKEVCAEINKKDFTGKSADEMQVELGLAIMPSISSRMDDLKKYYKADASEELLNQVAEETGMKLAMECPSFLKMFSDNNELLQNSLNDKEPAQTMSGVLQKIVPGDFTYFQVKDPNGKVEKIWWMEAFEGADKLTDGVVNKPVTVTYNTRQTYNAQQKQYVAIKIATKLQVIQ